LSCASSGIGIAFGFSIGVFLISRNQNKMVLAFAIGLPTIIYAFWFFSYRESGIQVQISSLGEILKFTWFGIITSIQNGLLLTSINTSVVAAFSILLISLALFNKNRLGVSFGFAYLLAGITFYFLTGITRASFGFEYAASYRYMHIFFIFIIPLIALTLDSALKNGNLVSAVIIFGMLFLVYESGKLLVLRGEGQGVPERASQISLASSFLLMQSFPNSVISAKPLEQFAPQIEFKDLSYISENRAFDELELTSDNIAQGALNNSILVRPHASLGVTSEARCFDIAPGAEQVVSTDGKNLMEIVSFEKLEVTPNIPGTKLRNSLTYDQNTIPTGNRIQFAAYDFSWTISNTGRYPIKACSWP
jgi:hypothetical protein